MATRPWPTGSTTIVHLALFATRAAQRVERVLHEVRQDLDDLIAVRHHVRRPVARVHAEDDLARARLVELDDVARDVGEIELGRLRRRQAREAGELRHDVGDALHLVEHGARGLVEVVVERRVLPRAETAQRLDRGADGRERVLHLVRDASRDLAPRGDARRRGEAAARRAEVVEHAIERGRRARQSRRCRARVTGRASPLATLRASSARSDNGPLSVRARRNASRSAITTDTPQYTRILSSNATSLSRNCGRVLRDDDRDPAALAVVDQALRAGERVGRVRAGATLDLHAHRGREVREDRVDAARAEEADAHPTRAVLAAPRDDARLRGEQRVVGSGLDEVRAVLRELARAVLRRKAQERRRVGSEHVSLAVEEDELVLAIRAPLLRHELSEHHAAVLAGLERDEGAVDELPAVAGAGEHVAVVFGLRAHLRRRADARGAHLGVEALRVRLAALFSQQPPERRRWTTLASTANQRAKRGASLMRSAGCV